jgi:hypothetical protein
LHKRINLAVSTYVLVRVVAGIVVWYCSGAVAQSTYRAYYVNTIAAGADVTTCVAPLYDAGYFFQRGSDTF